MSASAKEATVGTLRDEAENLLRTPDLLCRAEDLMERLGLVGEKVNRRLVFLAGVGGLLREPVHLVVKGESSAGKNTLVRLPLRLLPEERVTYVTGLSEQALNYHEGPVKGVLVIEEAGGQKHAEYSLRVAMSEGRVGRMTVNKGENGRLSGETLQVEVSASIVTTTTSAALHAENQTRVFDLWVDESEEQTRRVLEAKARRAAGACDTDCPDELELWRTVLGLLTSREVTIPYADDLADRFPTGAVRARRDFDRVLTLIRVCTLLHQRQREEDGGGRLVADADDYELIHPVIQAVLGQSMNGITEKALKLFELHEELAARRDDAEGWVWRVNLEREAHRHGVASKNTVHKWCKQFSRLGIFEGVPEGGRWKHRTVRDPRDEPLALPRPDDLPTASRSTTGRQTPSHDKEIQQSPSRVGRETGPGQGAAIATDWEARESPPDTRVNGSHPPNWEALGAGACSWCGEPRTRCGFCDPGRESSCSH